MSTVNPDVPAPAPGPTIQAKVSDFATQISDMVHHVADVVRADAVAVGNHFSSLVTTANVEGLIPELEAVLALLPPKLSVGEAAVVTFLDSADFAAFEKVLTAVGAAWLKEYLARKPLTAAPTVPASPPASAP